MNPAQIVLIEDNSADVLLVEMALKESRILYELTQFKNGKDALASLCTSEGSKTGAFLPDAIILDLNTPQSDGFEVLGKLRQNPFLTFDKTANFVPQRLNYGGTNGLVLD